MIVVDTNVLSEVMRPLPDARVLRWFDQQPYEGLYLSATSLAELLAGLGKMPDGQRKAGLHGLLETLRKRWFARKILAFSEEAAEHYARLTSEARRHGRAISMADGQIAAVAAVHGFTVATRDTSPFEAAGVAFVNPWEA